MISEGSCDTEDAEKANKCSLDEHKRLNIFKNIIYSKLVPVKLFILSYYSITSASSSRTISNFKLPNILIFTILLP